MKAHNPKEPANKRRNMNEYAGHTFYALLPRLIRLDPLVCVYLTDDFLLALRIGNQFSDCESSGIQSRARDADERVASRSGTAALEQLAALHIRRNDIVEIRIEHDPNFHMPKSPATVRIQLASGQVTNLLLLPESDIAQIADSINAFYAQTITTGKPREAVNKIKRSPQSEARRYLVLGCFFASCALGFLWFSLQQLANLPILVSVPPNILGAFHCFRQRSRKLRTIAETEIDG